jgi:hypothetical protein
VSEATEQPEVYIGMVIVARIHPGDREALEDHFTTVLCPFGHFPLPGDPEREHTDDCRMEVMASTTHKELAKVMHWIDQPAKQPA